MAYSALILLPTDTAAPLDQAQQRLHTFFDDAPARQFAPDIVRHERSLHLIFNTWSLFVGLATEPHVLMEAQEITRCYFRTIPISSTSLPMVSAWKPALIPTR